MAPDAHSQWSGKKLHIREMISHFFLEVGKLFRICKGSSDTRFQQPLAVKIRKTGLDVFFNSLAYGFEGSLHSTGFGTGIQLVALDGEDWL